MFNEHGGPGGFTPCPPKNVFFVMKLYMGKRHQLKELFLLWNIVEKYILSEIQTEKT